MRISQEDAQCAVWGELEPNSLLEYITVTDEGSGRWASYHHMILRHKETGEYWGASFEKGLTEAQDVQPFEYDRDGVELTRFDRKVIETVTYVDAK